MVGIATVVVLVGAAWFVTRGSREGGGRGFERGERAYRVRTGAGQKSRRGAALKTPSVRP